jgi:hypothetical protein
LGGRGQGGLLRRGCRREREPLQPPAPAGLGGRWPAGGDAEPLPKGCCSVSLPDLTRRGRACGWAAWQKAASRKAAPTGRWWPPRRLSRPHGGRRPARARNRRLRVLRPGRARVRAPARPGGGPNTSALPAHRRCGTEQPSADGPAKRGRGPDGRASHRPAAEFAQGRVEQPLGMTGTIALALSRVSRTSRGRRHARPCRCRGAAVRPIPISSSLGELAAAPPHRRVRGDRLGWTRAGEARASLWRTGRSRSPPPRAGSAAAAAWIRSAWAPLPVARHYRLIASEALFGRAGLDRRGGLDGGSWPSRSEAPWARRTGRSWSARWPGASRPWWPSRTRSRPPPRATASSP